VRLGVEHQLLELTHQIPLPREIGFPQHPVIKLLSLGLIVTLGFLMPVSLVVSARDVKAAREWYPPATTAPVSASSPLRAALNMAGRRSPEF